MSKRDRVDKMPGAIFATHPSEIFERVCCDCGLAHVEQIVVKATPGGRGRIYSYSARSVAATETWRGKMKLADWLALRSVCNAHLRRIKGKRKEQADEQSEG